MQISDYPEFLITLRALATWPPARRGRSLRDWKEPWPATFFGMAAFRPRSTATTHFLASLRPAMHSPSSGAISFPCIRRGSTWESYLLCSERSPQQRYPGVQFLAEMLGNFERGEVVLRGIKQIPHGVLKPGEEMPNFPFPSLDHFDSRKK